MTKAPDETALHAALIEAGRAHHDFETVYLNGVRDEQWAGWYAAHVHGKLGNFMAPSKLATVLEQTNADVDWVDTATKNLLDALD